MDTERWGSNKNHKRGIIDFVVLQNKIYYGYTLGLPTP